jgi:calcineurin-like phosphoesterase family protein
MTDAHARLNKVAGVLTQIEKECPKTQKTEPVFFIDAGDFSASAYSIKAVSKVYERFAEKNKHIKTIMNLGNCEFDDFQNHSEKFTEYAKNLTQKGVVLINATIGKFAERFNKPKDNVKPYTIVEDIINGEKKKVFITGVTTSTDNTTIQLQDQKDALRDVIAPAIKEHKPDKVILISHNYVNKTQELIRYMKEDLKIENLDLVIGGHPHSLEDMQDSARIIYPPAQGKGAVITELTSDGFKAPKMQISNDKYNYSSLDENKEGVIKNYNLSSPLEVDNGYKEIMKTYDSNNMDTLIAKSTVNLGFRKPGEHASEPSSIGTFITNAMRDQTKSDAAILLTMDTREAMPPKGQDISLYHIKDTLNANKDIYQLKANTEQLIDIFEASLDKQFMNSTNNNFLEFSDNLKIERFVNRKPQSQKELDAGITEPKVKQIHFKDKDGIWHALLTPPQEGTIQRATPNKEFEREYRKKHGKEFTMTIATCDFLATKGRLGIEKITQIPSEKIPNMKTEQVFINALKQNETVPNPKEPKSVIVDDLS